MRSADVMQGAMFSYVSQEDRIPPEHPLRRRRVLVDGRALLCFAAYNLTRLQTLLAPRMKLLPT